MIGPAAQIVRDALAPLAAPWAFRWENEPWENAPALSEGNLPVTDGGDAFPAVDAELIAGDDPLFAIGASADGLRSSEQEGLLRVLLSVQQGTGSADIVSKRDAIAAAFKRAVMLPASGGRLVFEDPRSDRDVAWYEEGNRYVVQISVPFSYWHRT